MSVPQAGGYGPPAARTTVGGSPPRPLGAMTPLWVLNGLYLVFAALFARRRLWVPAAIVLIVPLLVSWYFASLLQD